MRLRNVKGAREILEQSNFFVSNPEEVKGTWNRLFDNDKPIMLEIGMGKGDFILGMAKSHPEFNYVGIEKYESVLVRAIEKLDESNLENVKVINIDAIDVEKIFDREITCIYLNFSDPWPKKKHHKRRLTYKKFLEAYDKVFKDYANIELKTDNDSLFEGSLISLCEYGYIFDDIKLDLWNSGKENVRTEYENKFASLGFKIKYLKAHKKIEERNEI